MALSQNGWPVALAGDVVRLEAGGVAFTVRRGAAAVIFGWLIQRYADTVEPLISGQCGGWVVRAIGTGKTISNHASATAVDLNWGEHPDNQPAAKSMTAEQIGACRAIVEACDGVIRWGEDFDGEPDPMHWELVGTKQEAAALAARIERGDLPVALSAEDKSWLSKEIRAACKELLTADADPTPRKYSLGGLVTATEKRTAQLVEELPALDAKLDEVLAAVKPAGQV